MKKLIFILILLAPFICNAQWFGLNQNFTGGDPSLIVETRGTGSYSGTSPNNALFPASVNTDDILIIYIVNATDHTFSAPSGWTTMYVDNQANCSVGVFWRRADGTEGANVPITTGAAISLSMMVKYTNCVKTGTPYEGLVNNAIALTSSPTIPQLSSSTDLLAVGAILIEDDSTVSGYINYTFSNGVFTTNGTDLRLETCSQIVASGTVSSEVLTLSGTDYLSTCGFLLIPK